MRADLPAKRQRLLGIIRHSSLLQQRDFVLASGRSSSFFFDMKRTMLDPEGAALAADLLFDLISDEQVDAVGGLETGAIPIVAAVCASSWPEKPITGFFVRKEARATAPTSGSTACSKTGRGSSCSRMSRPPAARSCRRRSGPAARLHDRQDHQHRRPPRRRRRQLQKAPASPSKPLFTWRDFS